MTIFRSLQHRNFRLYYTGQLISLNGTWMQNVAQAWLMYRLTESSFMLGLSAFFSLFPVLLFSLWGGVLADRINRHRLLITAYVLGLLQALLLAILTMTGSIVPWQILVFSAMLGVIHAFEMPARHSFLPEMVDREDLPNAIALNSSAFNVARFIGPFLAGILVASWGEGPVFLLNAFSFIAVIIALLSMRLPSREPVHATASPFRYLKQGLAFAWQHELIRINLLLLGIYSMVGTALTVLMPVFAREVYAGESEILGALLGAMGSGALMGALFLAYRASSEYMHRQIGLAASLAGICLLIFAQLDELFQAMPLLILFGFCQTLLAASINTLIQSSVPDALRGRVMSIFSTIFIGFMPLGSLLSGYIAEHIGIRHTVEWMGSASLLAAVLYWFLIRYTMAAVPKDL